MTAPDPSPDLNSNPAGTPCRKNSRPGGWGHTRTNTGKRAFLGFDLKNPATADADYDREELAFLVAVDEYKRRYHRKFPTLRELFRILLSLGYVLHYEPIDYLNAESLPSEELPR